MRNIFLNISLNTILIAILMFVMTFFSYISIMRIPLYIFVLGIILITLLYNNSLSETYSNIEFNYYKYIFLFILLLFFQFLIYHKFSIFLGIASFISGLGIVLSLRYGIKSVNGVLFLVELFIIFQALIGVLAILQAFTGHFYFNNLNPHHIAFWNRPAGVEGMVYNFGKNYIFPIIFIFVALKYNLYKYSRFFTKNNLKLFLIYFIFILVLSKTRSTELSIFTLFFAYFIIYNKLYKLEYIFITLLLFFILFLFVMNNLNLFLDTSSKTRFILWYAGLEMFFQHPLIGVGIGSFGDFYNNSDIHISWIGEDYDHRVKAPHNIILGLLSETGIVGTFLILYPFIKVLKFLKEYKFVDIRLKIVGISIFYYFIGFFIDFQFHNYWNDNYFWFWIGLGLGILHLDNSFKKVNLVK